MKKNLLVMTGILALVACGNKEKETEKVVVDEAVQVKVATANLETLPQTEVYTGVVTSDIKNNISPNAPLRIEKIFVEVGDYVKKGQCLVSLDASNLRQLQLQIENTKVEYGRIEHLYNVGGISKSDFDNVKTQLEVMQTQYRQLSQNTQLYAPISGIVTARNYDNGDMYGGLPILTIEQTSNVKLKINVSELHYKDVKPGMAIEVGLDAYPGEQFNGKVSIVNPNVDPVTHTFPVEVMIANSSQKVRPGMFARATVNFGNESHVVVPDEALVKQIGAGDRYVYVYNPTKGTVSYNKVELGKHMDDKYEILSGVSGGDQVVVAGQARLNNGKKVKVVK